MMRSIHTEHKWNDTYLPLLSQPKLVLIYRPRRKQLYIALLTDVVGYVHSLLS